jgi:hypothetical protein
VSDIISQHGDGDRGRGRGPWPRRVAMLAVLVLAIVLIVEHLPRHAPATTGSGRPAVSTAPLPDLAARPTGITGISGLAMARDDSLRLPVAGEQPAWLWPATGRTQPIGGLPRDESGYRFIRVAGGWAVQATSAARLRCDSCAGPRLPVYFLADNAQSVIPAGAANEVAAGAAAGALWLTSYPPGADMSTAAGTAQQISVATASAGQRLTLPAGYAISQGTDRGLLLAPAAPSGTDTYTLWNPAVPRAVGRTFDGVLAASASRVAWATRCAPVCGVEVLDLATGQHTVVGLPGASSAVNGAFSPDGKFLSLQASFDNLGDDGALGMQIDVVSLASGRPTVVSTMQVSSDALVGFGWPAGSDDLVTELNFLTKLQVASWRPDARLAVAVVPGPESASLIVG